MKMNHMQSNSKPAATASMFRRALKRFAHICAAVILLLTTIVPVVAAPNTYHWGNLVSKIAGMERSVARIARLRSASKGAGSNIKWTYAPSVWST